MPWPYAQIRLKASLTYTLMNLTTRFVTRLTTTIKKKNNLMAMCWRNVFVTNDGNVGTIERFEEVEKWNFTSWCRGRSSSCIRPLHPFYLLSIIIWSTFTQSYIVETHCQRHRGSEGWVLLTKVTSLGHFTSSYTSLDQISSSESRPSINFKISTKPSFRISTKIQLHNLNI